MSNGAIKVGGHATKQIAAALIAILMTGIADGVRTAALATIAGGLLTATRVRFTSRAAVVVLTGVAIVSIGRQAPAKSAPAAARSVTQAATARLADDGGAGAHPSQLARPRRR
jgi:hypothetical protein